MLSADSARGLRRVEAALATLLEPSQRGKKRASGVNEEEDAGRVERGLVGDDGVRGLFRACVEPYTAPLHVAEVTRARVTREVSCRSHFLEGVAVRGVSTTSKQALQP